MANWLLIAAESREFAEVLKRSERIASIRWDGVEFVREVERWMLAANGPGVLAAEILRSRPEVGGVVSVGFAGALDPALRIGDIVVSGEFPETENLRYVRGKILTLDHVATTAAEKRRLWEQSGASVVEMEAGLVAAKAREWGLRFCCVKAVSDTAGEDMPLDFNLYRDGSGRFSRLRIAGAALRRPSVIPGLCRLDRNCRLAAESLGEFLADCKI